MTPPPFYTAILWAAEQSPSMHDLSEAMPATSVLYAIIMLLGGALVWFIVRDRNSISSGLERLTEEFKKFREDLADKYAKKEDVAEVWTTIRELDHKIDRVHDKTIERRAVLNPEGRE